MKSALYLLAAFAAYSAQVNADGVCYDPDHVGIGSKNANTVRNDLQTIKNAGYSHVRTYISVFGNTDMASIIAQSGLRSALGVPYPAGDTDKQAAAAIRAAQSGSVDYIFVGNENLGNSVPSDMIDLINSIKSQVPGNVKVGTVQTTGTLAGSKGSGWSSLLSACDAIGVNIHPIFTSGTGSSVQKAIKETGAQWDNVKKAIGDKLLLTETGWPTGGQVAGNSGSTDFAASYYQAYKSWSGFLPDSKKFYFQMFDVDSRENAIERSYGIMSSSGSSKYSAGGNPAPTTPPPTTPAPTTPAPTTLPPTTAPPTSIPPTNSTVGHGSSSHDGVIGAGSGSLGDEAGIIKKKKKSTGSSESEVVESAELESGVIESPDYVAPTSDATYTDGANAVGGKKDDVQEVNNQSSASTGSVAGIVVASIFGVAAVLGAFGFIYKARQKANELEEAERKSMDSLSITPHGGCAL
ncbi:hypothetical protein Poli38472_008328 [Pythium oligandrum]|uniref:glucan endo-1,3-beta-D-glucosidase n=1 Tax=Pythium oligandrum TaxID=41045 RepID=A0A8K1FK59_PYTOL|nr:hypothetical protein Poli38472_008328 [Pythium oligandrum]|eukprot:TMW65686.1 hypothetical protein Poli38472_008328 [Pythium oligandrum]